MAGTGKTPNIALGKRSKAHKDAIAYEPSVFAAMPPDGNDEKCPRTRLRAFVAGTHARKE